MSVFYRCCLYSKHDFCHKFTILICKVTSTTISFCDMAYGLNSYSISRMLCRLKNTILFQYLCIEIILSLNQKNMCMMQIHLYNNLSSGIFCFRLASIAFSRRFESTRHISISSPKKLSGISICARKGIPSCFA